MFVCTKPQKGQALEEKLGVASLAKEKKLETF